MEIIQSSLRSFCLRKNSPTVIPQLSSRSDGDVYTLLLDTGELMEAVQELLDHNKHTTITQIYDKTPRGVRDSASHKVLIWDAQRGRANMAAKIALARLVCDLNLCHA